MNEIHLFTTEYGYGWGTMVVIAATREEAVMKFLEQMKKEMYDEDDLRGYIYLGTMKRFGEIFYHYESE